MGEIVEIDNKKFLKIPIQDILNPISGRICYNPSYWVVTHDECVLFYRGQCPQANTNEEIITRYAIRKNCVVKQLPMTYLEIEWLGFKYE